MIKGLVSFTLHQPLFLIMLTVLFGAGGFVAFRSLPVEAFPDVTDVQVTVITLFPGHAPEEVEKQVTIPLEIALSGLPNAVRMFSHTQFGLSYIILTFNDNANDYFARQQVLERLQGIDLPGGVQPELAPLSTAIGEIYRYRVGAKGLSPAELRSIQDWVVARNLKMIPGVADVVSFGGFIKQYEVTVNTARMKSYGVTLQQVFTALGRGNANAGGSFLERGEQQYLIRGIGMLQSSDDLGDIVVAEHGGTPLLIRDIADVIPLSLLATFIGLRLRAIPANLLSLGAMDFGIIVDGAVIVLENVFRRLTERREHHRAPKAIVLDAAVEVGRPTLYSMLVIIIAHLPIFTLQRHEGRIFAPMAYTVVSALVGSLLFSLTLVPLLSFFLLRNHAEGGDNVIVRLCKRAYRPALRFALERRRMVLGAAVAALAGSLLLVPALGTEFLPELNEGALWINVMLPPGLSVTETSRQLARIRGMLRRFPEVVSVLSKAGRPEDGTDPKMINMAEFLVDVRPEVEWPRGVTKDRLIERMNASLQTIPGIEPSFSQPIRDNVLESISQIDGQVVVKIFGDDVDVLRGVAKDALRAISGVRGVARAFVDRAGQVPQLRIAIDRGRAARYGLNVADVEDVIETALGGRTATQLWEGERRFNVVVRLGEEERGDQEAIANVLIDTPTGSRIPLSEVANVSVGSGSMNIAREGGKRVAAIGVFIQGRDMGGVVGDMQERVATSLRLPPGYFVTWGGEFENQQRAMARLRLIVPISVLLIFLLLFNAFGAVKHAALILVNVPFALIGGILALYLTGIHLSVSAAIGFIALFGQAVLNGVVMVSCFNQLRRTGIGAYNAAYEGSLVRLRTVLMTTLLAMLGLTPMALSHSIGSEVQRSLAVVISGGLFSASALTLLVLPALYVMFEGRHQHVPEVTT